MIVETLRATSGRNVANNDKNCRKVEIKVETKE